MTAANEQFSHTQTRSHYILVVPADAFVESDGQVVMEAENAHVNTVGSQSWLTRTAFAGYEGSAYLQTLPDVGQLYPAGVISGTPELQYQVSFADAGTYAVWVRGAAANAAGDSLHVGLNGAFVATADNLTGFSLNEWGWSQQTSDAAPATMTIPEPGVYTITVWTREDGLRVDRLLLTTDLGYVPTGNGPAESPRAGEVQAFLLPHPSATVAHSLRLNGDFVLAQQRQARWAEFWATLLANPGALALAPLALVSPLAYNPRRRKSVQKLTAVLMALAVLGMGAGLASAGGLGPMDGGQYSVFGDRYSVIGDPATQYAIRNTQYGLCLPDRRHHH